jgi:hypothetical protein
MLFRGVLARRDDDAGSRRKEEQRRQRVAEQCTWAYSGHIPFLLQ